MKILVTGGAGYIGGTVTRSLLAGGHSVTIYDNLCHSKPSAVASGADFVEGDLADRTLLEKTLIFGRFQGVMHFAALIEAGESMQRPEIYFRNNTAGTLTLLEAMLATGHDRLVFSSTAACYGEPVSTPILEDAKLEPTNAYGESKLMVEHMLRWFNRVHGFRYASLRYFNVAGAIEGYGEAHEPESHLIPADPRCGAGKAREHQDLRAGLPDARWHLHPRLHPCERPGGCASAGAGGAGEERPADLQHRQRTGLYGARGDRLGAARNRPADPGGRVPAAGGRSGGAGGELGEDQAGAWAGSRSSPIWTRLLPARGSGTRSVTPKRRLAETRHR